MKNITLGKIQNLSNISSYAQDALNKCHCYEKVILPVFYQEDVLFSWLVIDYDIIHQYIYIDNDGAVFYTKLSHYNYRYDENNELLPPEECLIKCYLDITASEGTK